MMQTVTSRPKKIVSFFLVLAFLFGILVEGGLFNRVSAAEINAQSITTKLNDVLTTDDPIVVSDGDALEVQVNFTEAQAGSSCTIALPEIFLRLNQATIEAGNASVLSYIDFSLNYDAGTGLQTVTITFKETVAAAAFVFVGTLNIENGSAVVEKEISIGTDHTITLETNPGNSSGGSGIGKPIEGIDQEDREAFKKGELSITESNFMEDTNVGNAYYYVLGVNAANYDQEYQGTLSDTLPTGMKLFFPSAPGTGANGDYQHANRSFYFAIYETIFKSDGSGGYYGDLSMYDASTQQSYIDYINGIEAANSRSASYTLANLNKKLYVPTYLYEQLDNGDGKLVSQNRMSLGYRIDESGNIQISIIDSAHMSDFDLQHTGAWTNSSKPIPLYDDVGTWNSSVYWESPYVVQNVQSSGNSSSLATYKGAEVDGTKTTYTWDYAYGGVTLMTLKVTYDSATQQDSFDVLVNVTETSLTYGKLLTVCPYIYFDQDLWSVPSDGKLTFTNTATYNGTEKSATTEYTYNFGSAGTVVVGQGKEILEEDGATDVTYWDPDSDDTAQTYALYFQKTGDEVSIIPGNFNVRDVLDGNLDFVENSIKIYKENGSGGWTDITTTTAALVSTATGSSDGVNLEVSLANTSALGDYINIVNTGDMTYAGGIKVEFDVQLKEDVAYGTKIINYFGDTVTTYVDHKIAVRKVDEESALITNNAAEFTLEYTTESNYKNATLVSLDILSTGITGIAELNYQLEEDTFYLKLTETSAPSGYVGIASAVWMKATRNSVTNAMSYELLEAPEGVTFDVVNGLIKVEVANELTTVTPTAAAIGAEKSANVSISSGQFRFALLDSNNNVVQLATNQANGSIAFEPIQYTAAGTHNYKVVECGLATDTPWTVGQTAGTTSSLKNGWTFDSTVKEVTVSVTGTSTLSAAVSYADDNKTFTNTYTPGKADAVITGTKEIAGIDTTDETFTFSMIEVENAAGDEKSGAVATTTTTTGADDFSFALEDLEPGTYYYKITETAGDKTYWNYDTSSFIVTVVVTDNGQGAATAAVIYSNGQSASDVVFTNEYTPNPTTLYLEGLKIGEGRDLTDKQFSFAIYEGGTEVATGTNDENGIITFTGITYTEVGTHTYTIRETSRAGSGWAVDDTVYTITVEVTNDGLGSLSARVTSNPQEFRFVNSYTVTGTAVQLRATKVAEGAELINGQFLFAVYEGDTPVAIGTNRADGRITFSAISYAKAGVYTYTVKEISRGGNGWTVDATEYTVTVTVIDNGRGALEATVSYPQDEITFTNRYTPPAEPGDGAVTLRIRKRLVDVNGNQVGDGKRFVVRLYDTVQNLIRYFVVTANGEDIIIEGLDSGTTYYLAEEEGSHTILGYEFVGAGSTTSPAIGFRIPQLAEGQTRTIEIIVNNQTDEETLIEIPDENPPLAAIDPPGETPIIDIPDLEIPLSSTGDGQNMIWPAMISLVAILGVCALVLRKKRNRF